MLGAQPYHIEWPAVIGVVGLWCFTAGGDRAAGPGGYLAVADCVTEFDLRFPLDRVVCRPAPRRSTVADFVLWCFLVLCPCLDSVRQATASAIKGAIVVYVCDSIRPHRCFHALLALGFVARVKRGSRLDLQTQTALHDSAHQNGISESISSNPLAARRGEDEPPAPPRISSSSSSMPLLLPVGMSSSSKPSALVAPGPNGTPSPTNCTAISLAYTWLGTIFSSLPLNDLPEMNCTLALALQPR